MIENIIKQIIKTEGGYVNNPLDKGGPTKYGITQQTLSNHLGREVDTNDIKSITKQEAEDIYEQHYYHYPKIDLLPEPIQHLMLDMSVNHGPRRAIKILQQELSKQNLPIGKIDGIIGQKTIKCSEKNWLSIGDKFINNLIELRLLFYKSIVKQHPDQKVFFVGWIKRTEAFRPQNKKVFI